MARFSKSAMVEHLELEVARLAREWGFDPNNGTSQLRGKGEDACVAYGEFRSYLDLIEVIEEGRV